MKDIKELLEKRKAIKKKKPKFIMQDAHKLSKLKKKWRRPRGSDSKMRQGFKSYNKCVEPGYGSPKEVKGLDRSGLEPIIVNTLKDLENINKEKQGIIISSAVGKKKKVEIIKKANELTITILNIKDSSKYLNDVEQGMKQRKEERLKKSKKKAEKKVKEEKKEKKDDKLAEKVLDEEDKVKEEKKEKDKVLTKKEI